MDEESLARFYCTVSMTTQLNMDNNIEMKVVLAHLRVSPKDVVYVPWTSMIWKNIRYEFMIQWWKPEKHANQP